MYNAKTFVWALALLCFVAICPNSLSAQNNKDPFEAFKQQMDRRFNDTKQVHDKIYNSYRDSLNNAYSQYIQKQWASASVNKKVDIPRKPEPKPIVDTSSATTSRPLPHTQPTVEKEPAEAPKPLAPITAQPKPDANTFTFSFYGALCKVRVPASKLKMADTSKQQIAEAWDILSSGVYDQFLVDCQAYKESLNLCDWGVYQFVTTFTHAYFGSADQSEAVVFQMYALSQFGYKIRLASQESRLIALVAFKQEIFSKPFIKIDGDKFYYFSSKPMKGSVQLCEFSFPNERSASLQISKLPNLPYTPSDEKVVKSKAFPNVVAKVNTNKNLINFLDTYPSCSWDLYASASLSPTMKEQLYPTLKEKIRGASEKNAANILLNFVQTGFEYKTDNEQFGREKIFFGDEPFYYPFCDCEDRSILFAILVRDLIGLEVVLLDYPSHIATAVCFNEEVTGDYLDMNGRKYVICDPTYIGAPIGKSMPDMMKLKANVLKIN